MSRNENKNKMKDMHRILMFRGILSDHIEAEYIYISDTTNIKKLQKKITEEDIRKIITFMKDKQETEFLKPLLAIRAWSKEEGNEGKNAEFKKNFQEYFRTWRIYQELDLENNCQ